MKTSMHYLGFCLLFFCCTFTAQAQDEWLGSTTNAPSSNINDLIYRNGGLRIGHNTAPPANTTRTLSIHSGTVSYGARSSVYGKSAVSGGTAVGESEGFVGLNTSWYAAGTVRGMAGYAKNVTSLDVGVAGKTSSAFGGFFSTQIDDPLASANLASGRYYIAGTMGDLSGTITTYPTDGVVAAVFGRDNILGSGTWGGYFQGRGYFSQNVGIASTNPLSTLSVNGDGDSRWSIYGHTTSQTSGAAGIVGQADQPTGFADHVRAVQGTIESGYGYTYGVSGGATSTTPSNAGRAYGVYGVAGNATSNYNYGVFGRLFGQNNGTAILGHDHISHPGWNGNTQGNWAGYFVG
ncbi:MAG: hypothetical protein AAF798_22000, partial [Bacteroidota bacterium]